MVKFEENGIMLTGIIGKGSICETVTNKFNYKEEYAFSLYIKKVDYAELFKNGQKYKYDEEHLGEYLLRIKHVENPPENLPEGYEYVIYFDSLYNPDLSYSDGVDFEGFDDYDIRSGDRVGIKVNFKHTFVKKFKKSVFKMYAKALHIYSNKNTPILACNYKDEFEKLIDDDLPF